MGNISIMEGLMMNNTVTQEQVLKIFSESKVIVKRAFGKTTVVICKLPCGFVIVESSSCVDPANYDESLGYDICKKRIINKIWELEGYSLQKKLNGVRYFEEGFESE
jgi:hypothetical protein